MQPNCTTAIPATACWAARWLGKARQLLARPRWLFDVGLRGKPHRFGHLVDAVADSNDLQS